MATLATAESHASAAKSRSISKILACHHDTLTTGSHAPQKEPGPHHNYSQHSQ